MKALLSALSVGLALMVMGTSASAVPFSYRFESTVSGLTTGFSVLPGDPASITVTLDNGGMSDLSQVWTAAHLQSVTIDVDNGAVFAIFFSPFDGGLDLDIGSFETDAAGTLTSVPSFWSDVDVTTNFGVSFPIGSGLGWTITDANPVLFDGDTLGLFVTNTIGLTDPANWSRVTSTALPLPPTLLLLIVGLGGVALLRRAGHGAAGGFAEARGV